MFSQRHRRRENIKLVLELVLEMYTNLKYS